MRVKLRLESGARENTPIKFTHPPFSTFDRILFQLTDTVLFGVVPIPAKNLATILPNARGTRAGANPTRRRMLLGRRAERALRGFLSQARGAMAASASAGVGVASSSSSSSSSFASARSHHACRHQLSSNRRGLATTTTTPSPPPPTRCAASSKGGKPTTTRRRARATTVRAADDAAEADAAMVQNNAIGRAARGKAKKTTASSSSSSSSTTTAAAAPAATRPPLLNVLADDALGPAHASATTWIVFSDLHVNRKTSDVCVQVLDAVLAEARLKNAGVVFLGDWWHARGAIPVEPLNASLDAIRAWDVPVVMIPGNHDQVTAGGELHALAPLRAANPERVRVFDSPTFWRGALWLPYRRDHGVLRDAVREAKALRLSGRTDGGGGDGGPALRAIFCHADVKGAAMNESFQAKDGVDPELFAVKTDAATDNVVPTFTGHYHKPHTVANTSITYVGSPYQVSRAEAGQRKALVVLDASNGWAGWTDPDSKSKSKAKSSQVDPANPVKLPRSSLIPIDLGPRHFALSGEDAKIPRDARAGDVLRWTLPLSAECGTSTDAGAFTAGPGAAASVPSIERARAQGIHVEVSYETKRAPARIPKAEELGPVGLYDAYAKAVRLPPDVAAEGRAVLAEVAMRVAESDVDGTGAASLSSPRGKGERVRIAFKEVEVEGFGAFSDAVTYPLRNRGVCVVVGDNRDDRCSDSNGAGKTTLVMATAWALTGNSDVRVEGGSGKTLTKTDVVNDDRKSARVRVEGYVNGEPFWVERKVSRTKLISLRYGVCDEERTMADSRMTQIAMDRDLGASVASRVAFHGETAFPVDYPRRFLSFRPRFSSLSTYCTFDRRGVRLTDAHPIASPRAGQHTVAALLDANDATLKAALGELVEADTWTSAKELSRKKVSEARKRAAALGADAKARRDYVRRTEGRRDAAQSASASWREEVQTRLERAKAEETRASSALSAALGACAASSAALRAASAAWDAEEEAASSAVRAADDEMWGSEDAGGGAAVDETAFQARAAALDAAAETARRAVAELQREEAAARAVASQAHRTVGAFQGVGGGMKPVGAHAHEAGVNVGACDRCLQPIDPSHHADTLQKLIAEATTTRRAHVAVAGRLKRAEAAFEAAARAAREDAAAANAARASAAAAAASNARRARDANEKLAAVRRARVNPHVVAAALARADAVIASSPVPPATPAPPSPRDQRTNQQPPGPGLVRATENAVADAERISRELQRLVAESGNVAAAAAANPHEREVESLRAQVEAETEALRARDEEVADAEAALSTAQRADAVFGTRGIQSYLFEGALGELSARVGLYMDALTGGALTMELRPAAAAAAEAGERRAPKKSKAKTTAAGASKSSKSALSLDASDDEAEAEDDDVQDVDEDAAAAAAAATPPTPAPPSAASAEKIEKIIHAHVDAGGRVQRSLRQLSGGERRRAALALALAHADLASSRGGVDCDLLVLDEVLQHLDGEGVARVAALLRCVRGLAAHVSFSPVPRFQRLIAPPFN